MPRRAKVVAFSTSPEMASEIDRVAAAEDRTRSELLRETFRYYTGRVRSGVVEEAAATYGRPAAATVQSGGSLPGFELVRESRLEIKRKCRARDVARLWVFGSATRPDFDRARSDVDFVVEWLPGAQRGPWLSHLVGLEADLAEALGRPVDVVESDAIRNRRLAATIEREKVLVYESA